jgi:hypothetical protein
MVREIVFGVGFALLLPRFFGLDGVLYSMPLSDILTFAIALVLIVRTCRELSSGPEGGTAVRSEDKAAGGRPSLAEKRLSSSEA